MSESKVDDAEWLTTRTFLLLLAAALVAAFPFVALGSHTFFYRDFGALGYPGAVFTRDSLLRGELPLWNPYSHCGVPWLAQMGQWYPPGWICYLLPLPWAENFSMLAHLWFGGFGIFWLLRRWGLGNFAAAFAGFAFVFNGVSLSCLLWGNYIASLAWLPWVVGCVIEAWRKGGRWLPLAAGCSAMQVLTATPEITLLTWLFLGGIWLSDVCAGTVNFVAAARRAISTVLLAAGITMIQMLPFFDLLSHSQRTQGTAEAANWPMPGWGWASLLVPLFHCYQAPQGPWFQHEQEFLASYYLGAGILALAILGALRARNRIATAITAMTLFCWIMALGPHGYFYGQIKAMLPLVGVARFPVKFTILTAFLVPLLAAWGIQRLEAAPGQKSRLSLAVVGTIFLLFMAALLGFARKFPFPLDDWNAAAWNTLWRALFMLILFGGILLRTNLRSRLASIAVGLIVLAMIPMDALTHSPDIAPTLPSAALAPGIWQASGRGAPPKLGAGRIMASPDAEQHLLYSRVTDFNADFIGKRLAEWYNLNLLDGIPKVAGAITLRPAHFDILERYLYYTVGGHCGRGLVDFLSAAWLSSADNPTVWQARTNFLPVISAGQKPIFANDEQTLQAITAENFEPREFAYLPEAERATISVSHQTTCAVTEASFNLNQIEASLNAAAPSLVIFSQSYYHLWRAFVDGKPVRILRANLAFQAVEVPAGIHHLKLVYRDPNLEIGALISALSLAACGLIWLRAKNRLTPP